MSDQTLNIESKYKLNNFVSARNTRIIKRHDEIRAPNCDTYRTFIVGCSFLRLVSSCPLNASRVLRLNFEPAEFRANDAIERGARLKEQARQLRGAKDRNARGGGGGGEVAGGQESWLRASGDDVIKLIYIATRV